MLQVLVGCTWYQICVMVRVIIGKSHLNSNRFSGSCCVQYKGYRVLTDLDIIFYRSTLSCKSTFTHNTGTGLDYDKIFKLLFLPWLGSHDMNLFIRRICTGRCTCKFLNLVVIIVYYLYWRILSIGTAFNCLITKLYSIRLAMKLTWTRILVCRLSIVYT